MGFERGGMWKAQDLKKKLKVLNIYAWRRSILKIRKTRAAEYLGQAFTEHIFLQIVLLMIWGKHEKKFLISLFQSLMEENKLSYCLW